MTVLIYDVDGVILRHEPAGYAVTEPGLLVMPVPASIPTGPIWVDPVLGEVKASIPVTPSVDKARIEPDGADTATISGLPDPCWIAVNGETFKVTGGAWSWSSSHPDTVTVIGIGPYCFDPIRITAETLSEQKAALWDAVKIRRDAAIDGGCVVPGIGAFDSDLPSRLNINGAVTGAILAQTTGAPFAVQWKLADNSIAHLSAAEMIAVGVTVMGHVSLCHGIAQMFGEAITAAVDQSELDAIDIEAGWPGA